MKEKKYLCIHGHFYQPPRENPWTEEIELQPSARPYHDWNERINQESYRPNSIARVLDQHGYIVDIVNNYESISFNFGPTLMSWLEKKDPDTYKRIIEANQRSIKKYSHCNAIAQAYNHMILPLANRRDKTTQVKWGIADYRKRFEVEPESIWLPETACNEETLEVLIEEGIRFIILEPHQAESIRAINTEKWHDVSEGNIDTKRAYRCFLEKYPNKFIDIFFYDGPLSKAVGFEDVLSDAHKLMDKINATTDHSREEAQLISISTDGETYGHHKAFADRVLAYLLNVAAPQNGYKIINYAQYLTLYPPKYEVKLKPGDNGEGTSWSCEHGVKRWKEHCGCRGDGPAEWNQYWRTSLRHSLDYLRDQLALIYEEYGSKYFTDPWDARNHYIELILNRDKDNSFEFIKKVTSKDLSEPEVVICLKLLEMQRYAMLMYTSCAWFFTELSGIETVQVIQYAAHALELGKEILVLFQRKPPFEFEEEFLRILSDAKSNLPEFKDGKYIYENFAKAKAISLEKVAAHYAIMSSFDSLRDFDITNFTVRFLHHRQESFTEHTLSYGHINIYSKTTLEEKNYIFIVLRFGTYDFRCSLKSPDEFKGVDLDKLEQKLFDMLYNQHIVDLHRKLDEYFGENFYSLHGLFQEEHNKIMTSLAKEAIERLGHMYEAAYEENRRISEFFNSQDIPIPKEMKFISEFAINKRFLNEIFSLANDNFSLKKTRSILKLMNTARLSQIQLETEEAINFLSDELESRIHSLENTLDINPIRESINILKIANKLGLALKIDESQLILFSLLKNHSQSGELTNSSQEIQDEINQLAKSLKVNIGKVKIKVK